MPFLEETVKGLEARGATVVLRRRTTRGWHVRLRRRRDGRLGRGRDVIISFVEGAQIVQGLLAAGVAPTEIFGADGIAGAAFADNFPSADVLEGMRFTAPTAIVPESFEARLLAFNPNLVDFLFAPNAYDCVNLMALAASGVRFDGLGLDPRQHDRGHHR